LGKNQTIEMNVLIIEDEAPAYRRLAKLITECDSSIQIVGIIESVKDGIAWFSENPLPDLIFSDIQLADDLSFTIFKQLNITTPIIFITAFDEYAINAFKFYSIDYLLKPVGPEDLKTSIEKYKNIHNKPSINNFEEFVKKLTEKNYRSRFLVSFRDGLIPIEINDIAYFYSEDSLSFLVTKPKKSHIISETLDSLESQLDPKLFFRANRQFILSAGCVTKVEPFFNQKLIVKVDPPAEQDITISKNKATSLKEWLNS
jgi:two-component system, LytTR family, response regulator LytT